MINHSFYNTGNDYAGSIQIKRSGGRGITSYKGYIAIFVCMATKAVHLEAVGDLTSQTFIAALKRLIARRGLVKTKFSDIGTNFVGAKRILDRDFKKIVEETKKNANYTMANMNNE